MPFPVQISFQQMTPSPALRARIRELAARLERFSANILRCRVRVTRPARHKQQGAVHRIHMDIWVPDEQIVITHARPIDHAHEDVYVALRDAFSAARRRLEDYERKRQGKIKRRAGVAQPAPKSPDNAIKRPGTRRHTLPIQGDGSSTTSATARSRRR